MTESSESGFRSGVEKFMDPVCPERLDPDPSPAEVR